MNTIQIYNQTSVTVIATIYRMSFGTFVQISSAIVPPGDTISPSNPSDYKISRLSISRAGCPTISLENIVSGTTYTITGNPCPQSINPPPRLLGVQRVVPKMGISALVGPVFVRC